jgi:hypothetical protein
MKTLLTALTLTALIAGVSAANAADPQTTGVEIDYQLSKEMAGSPAYASARVLGHTVSVSNHDVQLQGR